MLGIVDLELFETVMIKYNAEGSELGRLADERGKERRRTKRKKAGRLAGIFQAHARLLLAL